MLTVGDRHVVGFDREKIDEALGVKSALPELGAEELVQRAKRLLSAALQHAQQLPSAHYDTPIPGLQDAVTFNLAGSGALVLSDGRPYVPHATNIGLFRHIIAHGSKLRRLLEREPADYENVAAYAPYGELLPELGLDQLSAQLRADLERIDAAWVMHGENGLDQAVATWAGPQTLRQILSRDAYSLAQHARQLQTVIQDLGIEPRRPIDPRDFEGLGLPDRVWS